MKLTIYWYSEFEPEREVATFSSTISICGCKIYMSFSTFFLIFQSWNIVRYASYEFQNCSPYHSEFQNFPFWLAWKWTSGKPRNLEKPSCTVNPLFVERNLTRADFCNMLNCVVQRDVLIFWQNEVFSHFWSKRSKDTKENRHLDKLRDKKKRGNI